MIEAAGTAKITPVSPAIKPPKRTTAIVSSVLSPKASPTKAPPTQQASSTTKTTDLAAAVATATAEIGPHSSFTKRDGTIQQMLVTKRY